MIYGLKVHNFDELKTIYKTSNWECQKHEQSLWRTRKYIYWPIKSKSKNNIWAILELFVQASKCHRNPWKSHFLSQKVPQSTIWNGSSVKWTLVDLDFAFVNDFQFSVCPSATKMNYFELHYKWLHLVLSWQIQVSLWNSFLETFQKYPMIF